MIRPVTTLSLKKLRSGTKNAEYAFEVPAHF